MKPKILIALGTLILGIMGCTAVKQQQQERDARREMFQDARREALVKRSRDFLSDDLLGTWRFLELVVEERGGSEDILKVKADRTARRLHGVTLRFSKRGGTAYVYQIENMMTKSTGTYTTGGLQMEEKPKRGDIRFHPIIGTRIPDLLFGFTAGLHRQVLVSMGENVELYSTRISTDVLGISVEEKQMDLTLDLGMVLAPDGWLHRGNIRCAFERIE